MRENDPIPLNYMKFKDFIVQLGFLTESKAMVAESKERGLLYDIWKILHGEQNQYVYIENIRVLAQVIARLTDQKRVIHLKENAA